MDSLPRVSIVTVCLNSERTIRRTIESVLGQSYSNIEYIIIDGGSTDATMNIVAEYGARIAHVLSEPDEGISDAFNKGVHASHGDFLGFLNSDDMLGDRTLENAVKLLSAHPLAAFVFGDVIKINSETNSSARVCGDAHYARTMRSRMPRLNHPTVLVRRQMFVRYGLFEKKWKIAMDYEWLLRLHVGGETGVYSSLLLAYMNKGGISEAHAVRAFVEVREISKLFGYNAVLAHLYYCARRIKQYAYTFLGWR